MVADGGDDEIHDLALGVQESIECLPVRCLNLPACWPQQRMVATSSVEPGTLTIAAGGITVAGATHPRGGIGLSARCELHVAGARPIGGGHPPLPIGSIGR